MDVDNQTRLLHMHQFYADDARHQKTMMWETVKWFTPILTFIAGGWVKYYIDNFLVCKNNSILIVLLCLSIIGLLLSICSILLLRSFYRTNLINISMFVKVEEELCFDMRSKKPLMYYPGDENITWEDYRQSRMGNEPTSIYSEKKEELFTSKECLKKQLKDRYLPFKKISIFYLMKSVFYVFGIFFICTIFILFLT